MKPILAFMLFLAIAAPALAYDHRPWHLDVVNKSDKCVWFTIHSPWDQNIVNAIIWPGASHSFQEPWSDKGAYTARAQIYRKNCDGAFIEDRHDRFPSTQGSRSELSIHNSGTGYIMRHGP
jgi:hypothetical protein